MKRETNRIINYYYYYFYCSVETYPGWCIEHIHIRVVVYNTHIYFRTPGMVAVATPSRRTRNNKKSKLSRRARARTIVMRSANT